MNLPGNERFGKFEFQSQFVDHILARFLPYKSWNLSLVKEIRHQLKKLIERQTTVTANRADS